jgi:hypothetical protein
MATIADADAIDQPIPTEIVQALANSSNRERFTAPAKEFAAELSQVIQACADATVFSK